MTFNRTKAGIKYALREARYFRKAYGQCGQVFVARPIDAKRFEVDIFKPNASGALFCQTVL